MKPIRKSLKALIESCKIILELDKNEIVYECHQDALVEKLKGMIDSGLSPREIKEIYNLSFSNYAVFITGIGIKLKTRKESVINYRIRSGTRETDEKKIYYTECDFKFDPYSDTSIPGYDLLLKHGMYNPTTNKEGVCRDHIFSKAEGFRNKVDPKIISHKANCQFLLNSDNVVKGERCWTTLEELKSAIDNKGILEFVPSKRQCIPKSEDHKRKLSVLNQKYMMVTNETVNLRVLKTDGIPEGFRKGFVRKCRRRDSNPQSI